MNQNRQMRLDEGLRIEVIDSALATPLEHAKAIGKQRTLDDCYEPFFVADLSAVASQFRRWRSQLPRVEPFYAVKCNDDMAVLRTLAQLGAGFSCASKAELRKVLQLEVQTDRIIYENPCKLTSLVRFARDSGVQLMSFDSVDDLCKVQENFPDAKMVLRIQPQAAKTHCAVAKNGAAFESISRLIRTAKSLAINIVGVSFHLGSRCQDPQRYLSAVRLARRVFDELVAFGYAPYLLDIGGGFSGVDDVLPAFEETAQVVVSALDELFPPNSGVQIVAEPGRFMVERAFVLMTNVIAKRVPNTNICLACDGLSCTNGAAANTTSSDSMELNGSASCASRFSYYLNDGVYGSFSSLLYDQFSPRPHPAKRVSVTAPQFPSSLYGPSCDDLDCIAQNIPLPELFVGDWLYFENMGAYTLASSAEFSGMARVERFYVVHKSDATLFRRELAAMVAENGILTTDLVLLIGESFIEEVQSAASAFQPVADVVIAEHDIVGGMQAGMSSQLRDELKSVLRNFHRQRESDASSHDAEKCAIAQLETLLLNAFASDDAENRCPDEFADERPSENGNGSGRARVESVSLCTYEKQAPHRERESLSSASGSEGDGLTNEQAVTLIFD